MTFPAPEDAQTAVRSLIEVATELLQNPHKDVLTTEHLCHLILADLRFNAWVVEHGKRHLSDEKWMKLFEESERLHERCERACAAFQRAEWPRGRFEIWAATNDALRSVLAECIVTLDALPKKLG